MKRLVLCALAAMLVVSVGPTPKTWSADQTVREYVDDALITTTVKAKLAKEHAKNLVKVNVDTQDGIVNLKGTVPTAKDKAEAERLARDTKGVRDVTNTLRVEAAETSPSASPGPRY